MLDGFALTPGVDRANNLLHKLDGLSRSRADGVEAANPMKVY